MIKSIAFPSISTGVYGYPKEEVDIAIKAVLDFTKESNAIEEIIFVLFSKQDYELYREKLERLIEKAN